MSDFEPTIGIECHVQLKTKTKLFAAVGNDAREAEPNTLISHICLGMPGALPYLNEQAVDLACRAAFALGVEPQKFSKFDRKHYFYPDLPKGYQITQLHHPIVLGGKVKIKIDGKEKPIGVTRAHLEEDAGKNTHPEGKDYSLVDLNRAGTPLLEIVSEPDLHSAQEAKAYATELYLLMKYADVTEGDLYHGNMRFDVNVSVSKDSKLGIRTETKNLNSFKSVEKAIEYEIKRQTELIQKGKAVTQETRGWDDAKQKTTTQRSKEEAHDYRYMPDPDIPPLELTDKFINKVKSEMPVMMPDDWRYKLKGLGLNDQQIEILIQSELELQDKISILPLIEQHLSDKALAKFLANWNVNVFLPLVREGKLKLGKDYHLALEKSIYDLTNQNKLSSTNAKALFEKLISQEKLPEKVEDYAKAKGYIQVSDESEIAKIVSDVLTANPQAVEDIKKGEMKATGFLVGQVMKASRGQANPALAQKLIKSQIDKL
ncbi:glutaminyl-tRNA synthase (glutamine-hydrolyzing) subunit B [Candidatus Saccharibacteria bacterium RIFCSPHIGHO2_12_FULL_41_12]|nr:MAG: glutaminyl-tRNA synthase (glutamine-hydrolyzing) subunit B [Candidatus Saccharibacteria bacterium RIFCSPHIGHO2_12_FULL_41_12]